MRRRLKMRKIIAGNNVTSHVVSYLGGFGFGS